MKLYATLIKIKVWLKEKFLFQCCYNINIDVMGCWNSYFDKWRYKKVDILEEQSLGLEWDSDSEMTGEGWDSGS